MSLDRLVISVGIIIGKLRVVLDVRLAIVILLVPMLSSAICMMVNVIASQDSEVANVTSVKPIIGETQLWNVMLLMRKSLPKFSTVTSRLRMEPLVMEEDNSSVVQAGLSRMQQKPWPISKNSGVFLKSQQRE
uniref:Uncharacterized protein n=1 Tax=Timema genevievae TaxID=629358 RepID=A0A7R9PQV2_TIMGE|nr:unnamed protein product [Timema genevievae]